MHQFYSILLSVCTLALSPCNVSAKFIIISLIWLDWNIHILCMYLKYQFFLYSMIRVQNSLQMWSSWSRVVVNIYCSTCCAIPSLTTINSGYQTRLLGYKLIYTSHAHMNFCFRFSNCSWSALCTPRFFFVEPIMNSGHCTAFLRSRNIYVDSTSRKRIMIHTTNCSNLINTIQRLVTLPTIFFFSVLFIL